MLKRGGRGGGRRKLFVDRQLRLQFTFTPFLVPLLAKGGAYTDSGTMGSHLVTTLTTMVCARISFLPIGKTTIQSSEDSGYW